MKIFFLTKTPHRENRACAFGAGERDIFSAFRSSPKINIIPSFSKKVFNIILSNPINSMDKDYGNAK